ncbi:MAG: SRPBCC family protein [Actinobacteria bacterium]|nr:SRPBCC family protein [Actinomycetota bacterium]
MRVGAEAVLAVPPDEAWRALVSWEDQAAWMRDADSVRVLTSHREGVGVRLAVRTRVLSVPLFTEQMEVTLWEPPRRLVMAHRSFVRGVGEWTFEPVPGGTLFRWIEDLSLPVPVMGERALLVYRPFMRRLMRGALANLQAFVRGEAK